MYSTLTTLIDKLDYINAAKASIILWGSPVPAFGSLSNSKVATLGLNPSNREFVDERGVELTGEMRRFHTLHSLGLSGWDEVDSRHLEMIIESCNSYFSANPYDRWFKKLDKIVQGTFTSYYDCLNSACHLDLVPYATKKKWADLSKEQRSKLLNIAGNTLAQLLQESSIRVLILNGQSVVECFEEIASIRLNKKKIDTWSLPRKTTPDVKGIAYFGNVNSVSGVDLNEELLVLGFNHNIQSSFGVTKKVVQSIREWVNESTSGVLD